MDTLPDEILLRIFSYFPVEDRILCLERVCWRWKSRMLYPELARLDVSDMHRRLCRVGSSCQVEMNRRHQMGNRRALKMWLEKVIESFAKRCGNVVQSLDLSGFSVDEKVGLTLQDFSRLEELNISNCYFSSYAAATLMKLRLNSLKMDGCRYVEDCVLEKLAVDRLSLTSRLDYRFVPKMLTSLTIESLSDANDLFDVVENCRNLNGFHLINSNIPSVDVVEILAANYSVDQMTQLTLAIHPNFFDHVYAAFPNLTHLSLTAMKDRNIPTKIDGVLSLKKLQRFQLKCRHLDESSFMSTVSKCSSLKELDVSAKRLAENVAVDESVKFAMRDSTLAKLKLSLECVTETTRVTSNLMKIYTNLKCVKLMSAKVKKSYTAEHNVSTDWFCVDFNEAVYLSKKLRTLTLPFLEAEENFRFVEYLSQSAVEKLIIYGGCFYFERNPAPKFKTFPNLTQLILGPYFQSLTGVDAFLPYLLNLRRFSFHADSSCMFNLLYVVGRMRELRVLEMRSCGKYILENLHVQLIPFLKSRRNLKTENSYLPPLIVNIFVKHDSDRTTPVSRKLISEFNELSVRFKIF